jgi:streptogramin lyase
MPSDRTRTSDDLRQRYKAVVMQQGRVILDRDFNALQEIVAGQIAADALDEIGPCGTPDGGFAISLPETGPSASVSLSFSAPNPWDFLIAPGTMYVGGHRVVLPPPPPGQPPWSYFHQPDWINPPAPDVFSQASQSTPPIEYVYLHVYEQEVGAVEDSDLLDVALGGPDTTQRVRLMWRVIRMPVDATDCATALAQVQQDWAARGFLFDPSTMRLLPQAALQVSFTAAPATSSPCDPIVQGGYLGADNQLIRLQFGKPSSGQSQLLWGYDDASFLYRVSPEPGGQTLLLSQVPVDAFHCPQPGQVVEVLRTTAILGVAPDATDPTGQRTIVRCVAEARGFITTVASYSNSDNTVTLNPPQLPAPYLSDPNPLFLRIWQGVQSIDPSSSQPIILTDPTTGTSPGIQVTITVPMGGPKGAALPVGAFWMIAVRPSTPQAVYPERFLTGPQPPDGPRQWICPLALIEWAWEDFSPSRSFSSPAATILDCRQRFCNLVSLCNGLGGCCTLTVRPSDASNLQTILDQAVVGGQAAIVCFSPGTYSLPQPLRLDSRHSGLVLEACRGGATLQADPGASTAPFAEGLMVLVGADRVTLRGLTIVPNPVPLPAGIAGFGATALIGLRPANSRALTLEDCQLQFPSLAISGNEFVFGAGLFLAGDCSGLTVQGCRFASQIPLTSTLSNAKQNPSGIAAGSDGKLWFTVVGPPAKIGSIDPKTHQIDLFPTPTPGSFPKGITRGPDGNLWFIESQPGYAIGMFNVATQKVTEFSTTASFLTDITLGPDGKLWLRDSSANKVLTINVTTFQITEFATSSAPNGIAAGPDGNIWYTEVAGKIGMINLKTQQISEYTIPTANSGPGSITAGPDGNLWFLEALSNKIASINPTTQQFFEVNIPTTSSSPSAIVVGPDSNLWFLEGIGKIGMLNPKASPAAAKVVEFAIPTPSCSPQNLVVGPDGNLWFFETASPNKIGFINPSTKQISEFVVQTNLSGLGNLVVGSDGNLWFNEVSSGQIGTINVQSRTISEYPVIASVQSIVSVSGVLAVVAETVGRIIILRDIPYLNDVTLCENEFSNLTLPVYAQASFGSCRLRENSVTACFSGFTLWALGSSPGADLTEAMAFSEFQLTGGLGSSYALPQGYSRIIPSAAARVSLTISNNRLEAQPVDSSVDGTAALLIVVSGGAGSLLIAANDVNGRTPMRTAPIGVPTVGVATDIAAAVTGNVFVNATPNNNASDFGQPFCLIIDTDTTGSATNLAVTGNVLVGASNLSSLTRPGIAAPLNTWSPFNSPGD